MPEMQEQLSTVAKELYVIKGVACRTKIVKVSNLFLCYERNDLRERSVPGLNVVLNPNVTVFTFFCYT
jgi:hypothetical protein